MEQPEVYLDANVFIYAVLGSLAETQKAQGVLSQVASGSLHAFTATLTVDEVLWVIQKHASRDVAGKAADIFFITPNLDMVNVDQQIIGSATEIYKTTNLNPRDSIHIAVMKAKRIRTMMSTDTDFDSLPDVKRVDFLR